MKALEWFILASYFAAAHFGFIGITPATLAILCFGIFIIRLIQGEKLYVPPPAPPAR